MPSAPRSGMWASVGRTAVTKVLVMGVAGVFGILNSRLIISHFGTDAYAQYGLLATFPSLMPFTDLGIGAVIINAVAGSTDPSHDSFVRRAVTTSVRVLLVSTLAISTLAVAVGLAGWWPALLGGGLMDGGGRTATVCLLIYAAALPLGIGQRVVVGLGRNATQVLAQGLVSPALTTMLLAAVLARLDAGNEVPIMSYAANTIVSVVCLAVTWRVTGPLLRDVVRGVPRRREVPGIRVIDTAGPQLAQSLVMPIAYGTDRLLLSHLAGVGQLAEYNLGAQLFGLVTQTVVVAGVAMWPQFARARAAGRVESPFRASLVMGGLGAVAALALWATTPWLVPLVSGSAITLTTSLILAYVAGIAVESAKQPLGMYMTDPAGLRFQVVPVMTMVAVNLAASWVLIAPLGAAGPVLGSAVAGLVCQVLPYAWWVRRDVHRRREAATAG